MDYFQGVVTEYLRADRAVFLNTECCIQLEPGDNPDGGVHWFCDAVAVNFRENAVFLCEVSYSKTLAALLKRLVEWNAHWPDVCAALIRDCSLPPTSFVTPWVFIPDNRRSELAKLSARINASGHALRMPEPKVQTLESVVPWKYRSWNGKVYEGEADA